MDIKKQRTDYLSWDEYFMGIAKLSALRSKDPSTQVGACIVSDDNRILSIGYNGAPNGFHDDFPPVFLQILHDHTHCSRQDREKQPYFCFISPLNWNCGAPAPPAPAPPPA